MFKNQLVEDYAADSYGASTLSQADGSTRIRYLKKVFLWSAFGLIIAGAVGFASAMVIASNTWLMGMWPRLIIIFGSLGVAQYLCAGMVRQPGSRVFGFLLANTAMGVALGFILLSAMFFSQQQFEHPFILIGQALGMTLSVALGLAVYVWTNPSEFRWAHAIVGALSLPLLVFMGLSFFLPFTGVFGLILSVVFVAVSVFGLLLFLLHFLSSSSPPSSCCSEEWLRRCRRPLMLPILQAFPVSTKLGNETRVNGLLNCHYCSTGQDPNA